VAHCGEAERASRPIFASESTDPVMSVVATVDWSFDGSGR
jgi:hypothetical protein